MFNIINADQVFTVVIFYTLVYNFSLFLFFLTIKQISLTNVTTLHFLSDLSSRNDFKRSVIVVLFSMAGIPPFLGFFTKLVIISTLTNSYLYFLYPLFFVLLFSGLYFYIQNIRLLMTQSSITSCYQKYVHDAFIYHPIILYFLSLIFVILLILGGIFIEDLLLYAQWIVT